MELSSKYHPIEYAPHLDLFGFFQSEKYFEESSDLIRERFKFRSDLLPPQWRNARPECAIHVRRGDYLKECHRFVSLQTDYYDRAISIMKQRGIEEFLIFSDDVEWCKKSFPQKVHVVTGLSDIQALCLMSKSQNQIIANSSFSWWGSWLCDNPKKMVIAPSVWYGFSYSFRKDTNYQYCPNWEVIPHKIDFLGQIASLITSKQKHLFFLHMLSRRKWLQAELEAHERLLETIERD